MRIGKTVIVSEFCPPRDNHLSLFLHAPKDSRFGQPCSGAGLVVLLRERWQLIFVTRPRRHGAVPNCKIRKLAANGPPVIKAL